MFFTVIKKKVPKKRIFTFALSLVLTTSIFFINDISTQAAVISTQATTIDTQKTSDTITTDILSKTTTDSSLVTYEPYSITKGNYTTPIWRQQVFWPKKSSAARSGCGYCCVAMALKLSGVTKADPQMVLKDAKRTVRRAGPLKAKKAVTIFKKHGVPATQYSTQSLGRSRAGALIKASLDQGKMVMALVRGGQFSGGNHWVLLTGYDQHKKIVVANSSLGTKKYCKKAKLQYHLVTLNLMKKTLIPNGKWNGFVVIGK
ncbi:MAG: C39 family peptidase [Eubacteriales bacterium]|nr:C39 family peptidase [Eubacteriales bacterium]